MHRAVGKKGRLLLRSPAERERRYFKALAAETQAKSLHDDKRVKNWDKARKHHAELENPDHTQKRIQSELDAFHNAIFSGPFFDLPGTDQKSWAFRWSQRCTQ